MYLKLMKESQQNNYHKNFLKLVAVWNYNTNKNNMKKNYL